MQENGAVPLYQIGEFAQACGVTRRTVLHYESKGLIAPAYINKATGYRYYDLNALSRMMLALTLKEAGLSLGDIAHYLSRGRMEQGFMDRLEEQRRRLERGMALLRCHMAQEGEYAVEWLELPARLCLVRSFVCPGVEEAMAACYAAVDGAIRQGLPLRADWECFCEFPESGFLQGQVKLRDFTMNVCLPVAVGAVPEDAAPEDYASIDCVRYPAGRAVSVCHRGSYANIGAAYRALYDYFCERGLRAAGPPQEIYMVSVGESREDPARYVTRVLVPVLEG